MLTDGRLAYPECCRRSPCRTSPQNFSEDPQLTELQTISPVNSFAVVFLKAPMVAIVSLHFLFPSPHHAASMGIAWPEATDDASLATGATRRTAQERLSCLARNGGARGPMRLPLGVGPAGEESRDAPLRLRWSRLQPSFGQISPLKRPFGALLGQIGIGDVGVQRAGSRSLRASPASPTRPGMGPRAPPTTRRPVALPSCHRMVGLPCGVDRTSKSTNKAAPAWPLPDPWHAARLLHHP